MRRSPVLWLIVCLLSLCVFAVVAPPEKTLGVNVRVVYLHGAWVWTALFAFIMAGLAGLMGLILRKRSLHRWSRSLGRTGLIFWITYLPISMWAMQLNWNGLFLAEPRFRLAVVFAIGGLVMQIGLTLLEKPIWASAANLTYLLALIVALRLTENVMHPPSPILDSDALRIQIYFIGLLALTLGAAWQVARMWYQVEVRMQSD